jgi:hypothetical protein
MAEVVTAHLFDRHGCFRPYEIPRRTSVIELPLLEYDQEDSRRWYRYLTDARGVAVYLRVGSPAFPIDGCDCRLCSALAGAHTPQGRIDCLQATIESKDRRIQELTAENARLTANLERAVETTAHAQRAVEMLARDEVIREVIREVVERAVAEHLERAPAEVTKAEVTVRPFMTGDLRGRPR